MDHTTRPSSWHKIKILLESFDEDWFYGMNKDLLSLEGVNRKTKTIPVSHLSFEGGLSTWVEHRSFLQFYWEGTPYELSNERKNRGKEIFSQVVNLIKQWHKSFNNPDQKADIVNDVIEFCNIILKEKGDETHDPDFSEAVQYIRYNGISLIQAEFADLLTDREYTPGNLQIRFNLNQDHLAYFLVMLMNGGMIEGDIDAISSFASTHFLVKKGKGKKRSGQHSQLSGFKKKMQAFANGNERFSDTADKEIMDLITAGRRATTHSKSSKGFG